MDCPLLSCNHEQKSVHSMSCAHPTICLLVVWFGLDYTRTFFHKTWMEHGSSSEQILTNCSIQLVFDVICF